MRPCLLRWFWELAGSVPQTQLSPIYGSVCSAWVSRAWFSAPYRARPTVFCRWGGVETKITPPPSPAQEVLCWAKEEPASPHRHNTWAKELLPIPYLENLVDLGTTPNGVSNWSRNTRNSEALISSVWQWEIQMEMCCALKSFPFFELPQSGGLGHSLAVISVVWPNRVHKTRPGW